MFSNMLKRRVVVTGLGTVSPLGLTVPQTWKNVLAGKSGVGSAEPYLAGEGFDPKAFSTRIWASVPNFDAAQYMPEKDTRKMDRFIQYAIAASIEAMADAGIDVNEANTHRIGVVYGSGVGGIDTLTKGQDQIRAKGPRKISPFFIPASIINMAAGHISIRHNLKGPNLALVTACTTGTHCIGAAARMIAVGDADAMVAGGSEYATNPICLAGFSSARTLSKRNDDPTRASRPWDKDRDGFVLGDGAATLVLEEYEMAKKRGANIYAEVVGFGMSADAYHITSPDETGQGAVACMSNALQDAGLSPSDIDYINAHGTSTQMNDLNETRAIKQLFGDVAYQVPVSSTKSMTGHLLGAAGAIEAIFSVLAIRDQVAPPTMNLETPDEDCDLDYIPNQAREISMTHVLSNSFGFGGTNGTLIFKKVE